MKDVFMLGMKGPTVKAEALFPRGIVTKSDVASDFCAEVPKSILLLTDLAESLFQPSDEAWLDPRPSAQAGGLREPAADERLSARKCEERAISRDELLALRSRVRQGAGAKMPSLMAKSLSSGTGRRSPPHPSKVSSVDSNKSNALDSNKSNAVDSNKGIVGEKRANASVESDAWVSSGEEDGSESEDIEVIIGPSQFAFSPAEARDLPLPDPSGQRFAIKSRAGVVCFSDIQRLTRARQGKTLQPVSFGSALHLNGRTDKCRPCLFERAPGRCRRLWLCDFCHMHEGRRQKVTNH